MAQSRTIIEVFLSSPDDVQLERDLIVQFAADWNHVRGRDAGCHISILTWQGLVAPAMGSRAQEVVNEQIGTEYDVYLGVFWTRIGTPTGVAESGTVEEFELALDRARTSDRPWIAALFKKAPIDPSTIEPSQLQKVQSFKQRLGELGGFYREFSDENSLRHIANLLFEQLAKNAISKPTKKDASPSGGHETATAETEEDEELGLIELGEQFEDLAAALVSRLKEVGDQETSNTETLKECTQKISDLTSIGRFDGQAAKTIVRDSAKSLKLLSDFYDRSLDELDDLFSDVSRLVEIDLRLRLEFDDPAEAAAGNIASMRELADTLNVNIGQMDHLIESTRKLPPMSTELKKARNRLIKSRERLKQMLVSLKETIQSSISFFEEQSSNPNRRAYLN